MKILSAAQIRQADAQTIAEEQISSAELMERAAKAFVAWFDNKFSGAGSVLVVCGPGNNGGDGLAIARLLHQKGYSLSIWIVAPEARCSGDFRLNRDRLPADIPVTTIQDAAGIPGAERFELVIDGIFGTGLSRPAGGIFAAVIQHLNEQKATVVAIDMPSGLFSDMPNPAEEGAIVRADFTCSFEVPKLAFFLAQNAPYVGAWHVVPIGLSPVYLAAAPANYFTLTSEHVAALLKTRDKFSHKGTFGHALLLAGAYGKMGAAVLAARACGRSGVGLLSLHCPRAGYDILQISVPEAMALPDAAQEHLSTLPDLGAYAAIGAGPGLGKAPATKAVISQLLVRTRVPLVLDADALNIIAEENLTGNLPAGTILTPHPKEFERLAGPARDDHHRLEQLQAFCRQYQCYVVLKGGHTAIGTPEGQVYFNCTGNPGMATGGSGDVLTGILTALVAQGYEPLDASLLGVFVHGLAGDLARTEVGEEALVASDLIQYLGPAFLQLHGLKGK